MKNLIKYGLSMIVAFCLMIASMINMFWYGVSIVVEKSENELLLNFIVGMIISFIFAKMADKFEDRV